MLKILVNSLKEVFKSPTIQDNLEKYILAHNPQCLNDVVRLEQEYLRRKTAITAFPFYHE